MGDSGSGGEAGKNGGEAGKNGDEAGSEGTAAASGPYVIYCCSEEQGKTAGLGTVAIAAIEKETKKQVKESIFESRAVRADFKKAGLTDFRKLVVKKETLPVAKKYGVTQLDTMIFCAPNGQVIVRLAGGDCSQTGVCKLLKDWPLVYEAWQKKNAK